MSKVNKITLLLIFSFISIKIWESLAQNNCELLRKSGASLFYTIKEGKANITHDIVNCSSDKELDERDEDGNTPLLLAALYGNKEIFDYIQVRNITYEATNNRGRNALHQAVIGGGIELINDILQRNEVSPNSYDDDGNTVLHLVALEQPRKSNDVIIEMTNLLLEAGATANHKNNEHLTPFHIILERNSSITINLLKTILDVRKVGYDYPDKSGRTPLQISLDYNDMEAFELFLSYNSNPYYTDSNGRTVIHNAVIKKYGFDYINKIIFSNKTFRGDFNRIISQMEGINMKDRNGYTALHLAAENGNEKIFNLIFNVEDINSATANELQETTVISAVKGGKLSIVDKLVTKTKSVANFINCKNREGTTALHLAVEESRGDIIELLLNNSANPEELDLNGLTSIELAASFGSLEIVKLFSGCKYNITKLLGHAVSNGNDEEVIKYFLQNEKLDKLIDPYELAAARGSNISFLSNAANTSFQYNFTEIMNFAINDHKLVLSELAEEDIDESYLSFISENNFLNIAIFFDGDLSIIKKLMNHSGTPNTSLLNTNVTWSPIDIAAFRNKIDIINYFLDFKTDIISRKDLKKQTIMHKAAWGGQCGVIEYLHKNKISKDLNSQDMFGRTPLHIAALRGYTTTVKCILDLDREGLNIRDKYEFTPLHLAEIYGHHKFFTELQSISTTAPYKSRDQMRYPGLTNRKRNHTATIQLLLNEGADPNAQDKTFGWTTLHWASANGDLKVVKMLVLNKGIGANLNIPSHSDQTPLYLARFWMRRHVYEFLKEKNAVW